MTVAGTSHSMMCGLTRYWMPSITMAKAIGNQTGAPRKATTAKPTARSRPTRPAIEGSERRSTNFIENLLSSGRTFVGRGVFLRGRRFRQLVRGGHGDGGGQRGQEGAGHTTQLQTDQPGGEGDEGPDPHGRPLDAALDQQVLQRLVGDEDHDHGQGALARRRGSEDDNRNGSDERPGEGNEIPEPDPHAEG